MQMLRNQNAASTGTYVSIVLVLWCRSQHFKRIVVVHFRCHFRSVLFLLWATLNVGEFSYLLGLGLCMLVNVWYSIFMCCMFFMISSIFKSQILYYYSLCLRFCRCWQQIWSCRSCTFPDIVYRLQSWSQWIWEKTHTGVLNFPCCGDDLDMKYAVRYEVTNFKAD